MKCLKRDEIHGKQKKSHTMGGEYVYSTSVQRNKSPILLAEAFGINAFFFSNTTSCNEVPNTVLSNCTTVTTEGWRFRHRVAEELDTTAGTLLSIADKSISIRERS